MLYILGEYQYDDGGELAFVLYGAFTDVEVMLENAPKNNKANLVYFTTEINKIDLTGLQEYALVLQI